MAATHLVGAAFRWMRKGHDARAIAGRHGSPTIARAVETTPSQAGQSPRDGSSSHLMTNRDRHWHAQSAAVRQIGCGCRELRDRVRAAQQRLRMDVMLRRALAQLTTRERLVCVLKRLGFSSAAIASREARPRAAIDEIYVSARRRVQRALKKR
jgi:hypothetical protein